MDIVTSYDNWGGKGDRRSIFSGNSEVFDGTQATYMYYGNNAQANIDIIFSGLEGKLYIDGINVILTNYGLVDRQLSLNGVVVGTYVVNQDYRIPMLTIRKNDKLTIKGRNNQSGGGTYPTYVREIELRTFLVPDKSFIYNEGEYKRFNEKRLGENIIPEMTSDTTPSGVAFGDSLYSSSYNYWYAFNSVDSQSWTSGATLPHYIGYDFGEFKKIKSYSIKSRNLDGNDLTTAPNSWILQGSINNSTWIDLDSVSGVTWASKGLEKKFELDKVAEYRYYRLYITANNGYAGGYVSLARLSLFEEDTPAHWEAVSGTLPTSTRFLEKGMYLSPLLDRRLATLEPIAMTQRNDVLDVGEVGKVFSETIDLKKYIDIRSIRVEVK